MHEPAGVRVMLWGFEEFAVSEGVAGRPLREAG